ncbi:MAG TPA: rod shape-determining protein MreB [Firmicutes bacterium]|nr:rod shape-determining protein MreB [Bacillota bacterium]
MLAKDIGIDLGTANVKVYVRGKGVVLMEPSVVAIDSDTGRALAVGEEARKMIGRTPGNIVAIRPLKEGVIADYRITEMMLRYFIEKVCGRRRLFRPQVVVCVPSGVTSVEKRAVLEACMEAGARRVFLISEPMAAAIGAGMAVEEPAGNMVVDIGGGTCDVAVISLGGEVIGESIRVAGDSFDDAITRYLRREIGLICGERTAEDVKISLGNVFEPDCSKKMEIRGRDVVTGLPRTVEVNQCQLAAAMEEPVRTIVYAVRSVLERTPPELSADIIDKGIFLTGGGALLQGMAQRISTDTGIPTYIAEEPLSCVALGTGKVLENLDNRAHQNMYVLASRS